MLGYGLSARASSLLGQRLVRNTTWMLFANTARLLLQAGYFVVIARALGVQGYGVFAAALAIVFTLVPFAGWGTGTVLLMHLAGRPTVFPQYWGAALLAIGSTSIVLITILAVVASILAPAIPLQLILVIAVSEFVFGRMSDSAAQAFQGLERLSGTALLSLSSQLCKVLAAVVCVVTTSGTPTPRDWAFYYAGASITGAAIAFAVVTYCFGLPKFEWRLLFANARRGFYFSLSLASSTIYNDIDKAMLGAIGLPLHAGAYAAAYRAVTVAFTPLASLFGAAYARFFREGQSGIAGSLRLARRILPSAAVYGALASAGLFVFAPLAPVVLGSDYELTSTVLRWLALLPLLKSLHYVAADTLTGAHFQGLRSTIQAVVAIANVGFNLWLIPLFGWLGAAWTSIGCDASLAICLWLAVAWQRNRWSPAKEQTSLVAV